MIVQSAMRNNLNDIAFTVSVVISPSSVIPWNPATIITFPASNSLRILSVYLCEIYTDVDGVYTADPRMVENTRKLAMITHDEMLELASLGAKVLHPRSVEIAKIHGVKLSVRSSFDTTKEGTFVVSREQLEKEFVVTGIACDQKVAKIGIFDLEDKPGSATKVFQALADDVFFQNPSSYQSIYRSHRSARKR